jgi:UDP-N-acetylmuramoyl-L-alanyl-D-glutamate--2,6-diaminopimelate ligase
MAGTMRLKEIVRQSSCCSYGGAADPEITQVSTDSRNVREGTLFIAVEGYRESGKNYIKDACERGARAIVVESRPGSMARLERNISVCYTENARRAVLLISRIFFGQSAKDLTIIGVTGTNGKTTVTYLIEAVLKAYGKTPGVIGTVSYRYDDIVQKANNTTPDPVVIQSLLSEMHEAGTSHCIIEVSSHALSMERVFPPDFDLAVFTNLSQDHLDFHGTMEAYFDAKARLFRGLSDKADAVINIDDEYGQRITRMVQGKIVTYGMGTGAQFRGEVKRLSIEGSVLDINGHTFTTNLIGFHNLYNILASYAVAKRLGIDDTTVESTLGSVKRIPGRLERVSEGEDINVFVDYAHTPDALNKLLDAAHTLRRRRIITVFGCGGDRDRKKRPLMGKIVEEKSDIAIITSDNPRSEDPLAIIAEIKNGLTKSNHIVIPDRRSAIFRAVAIAEKDDTVLIAGKGHEDYQILGDRTIHFDDREVAREALRGR